MRYAGGTRLLYPAPASRRPCRRPGRVLAASAAGPCCVSLLLSGPVAGIPGPGMMRDGLPGGQRRAARRCRWPGGVAPGRRVIWLPAAAGTWPRTRAAAASGARGPSGTHGYAFGGRLIRSRGSGDGVARLPGKPPIDGGVRWQPGQRGSRGGRPSTCGMPPECLSRAGIRPRECIESIIRLARQ